MQPLNLMAIHRWANRQKLPQFWFVWIGLQVSPVDLRLAAPQSGTTSPRLPER